MLSQVQFLLRFLLTSHRERRTTASVSVWDCFNMFQSVSNVTVTSGSLHLSSLRSRVKLSEDEICLFWWTWIWQWTVRLSTRRKSSFVFFSFLFQISNGSSTNRFCFVSNQLKRRTCQNSKRKEEKEEAFISRVELILSIISRLFCRFFREFRTDWDCGREAKWREI